MTDPVIPPKIVRDAARALRSGEHLIAEVLAAVLVDLRAVGWSVEPPPLRWGWSERHAGIPPSEPAEKSPPDGRRLPQAGEIVLYGPHPALVLIQSDEIAARARMLILHVFDGSDGGSVARNVPRSSWRWRDRT